MATVELEFSPLPENVRTARLLAATLARRAGLDEALIDEVKLAVGEACARAVGIHQGESPDERVLVTFSDDGDRYAISVRDCGPQDADTAVAATGSQVADLPDLVDVDALAAPASDSGATASIGRPLPPGFGLAVIAGLVDDLVVEGEGTGTVVRMAWPRPAQESPAG